LDESGQLLFALQVKGILQLHFVCHQIQYRQQPLKPFIDNLDTFTESGAMHICSIDQSCNADPYKDETADEEIP